MDEWRAQVAFAKVVSMGGDDLFDKTFVPHSGGDVPAMANQRTRIFLLRDLEKNPRTPAEISALVKLPGEALYEYARAVEAPGLAYAMFDTSLHVRTLHHIAAAPFRGTSMVFGRHSHTDSPTEANNLALRHLLITQRASEPSTLEVRDLRSTAGTRAIDGTRLLAAKLTAPMALDLGDLFLIAIATPVSMAQGAFLSALTEPSVSALSPVAPDIGFRLERFRKLTEARRSLGFRFAEDEAGPDSVALRLEEMIEVTPSAEQMTRGFLIGRYSRCDWPAQGDGAPSGLSRVHAMVFASQGAPYIVDTGSTNGVRHAQLGCLRYKHMEQGDQFWLGKACRLTVIEPRSVPSRLDA